jgi:hypothetical protein
MKKIEVRNLKSITAGSWGGRKSNFFTGPVYECSIVAGTYAVSCSEVFMN